MNEQELADLFSEQVDRLLQGEAPDVPPDTGDLQELLDLVGHSTTQSVFQATSATQAAFQSQLANWFGLANGGSPMTILGLSKTWFFSIIVTSVAIIAGAGFIAVLVTTYFFFGSGSVPPIAATEVTTETPAPGETPSSEPSPVPTDGTADPSETVTPSPDASETPEAPVSDLPTLIIINELHVASLCQGAYSTQSSLVNYGDAPVTNAALAWDVIEGTEFIDNVGLASDDFEDDGPDAATTTDQNGASGGAVFNVTSMAQSGFANFSNISVDQNVDLDIEVDVNDDWWTQPDGTQIKIQLSVENKIDLALDQGNGDDSGGDLNRGHGNDPDGYDEDNPGRGQGRNKRKHSGDSNHSQVITIVKQTAQFVTLTGIAHDNGDQSLIVDGTVVVINDCTGLPSSLVTGSNVQIIGLLQPDGTFIAINIVVINVNVINGDFDSGVPIGGNDDNNDGGGGGGGGGGRGGGHSGGHDDDD